MIEEMNCLEALLVLTDPTAEGTSRRWQAERHLAECDSCQAQIERLANAVGRTILSLGRGQKFENLTCAECQEVLGIYIQSEVGGRDASQEHPLIWRHLNSCEAGCRAEYEWLRAAMLEERAETLLQSVGIQENKATVQVLLSSVTNQLALLVRVPALQLKDALASPPPAFAVRGIEGLELPFRERVTLLFEILESYDNLAVGVELKRRHEPGEFDLQVTLARPGATPIPRPITVALLYNDEKLTCEADAQGRVLFERIPVASLVTAGGSLVLRIEGLRIAQDSSLHSV